jgi:hypothetical protein
VQQGKHRQMGLFSITLGHILAGCRCHHGDCSAFRSLELVKCHWPLQAALSGSLIKAPGFAGGYLPVMRSISGHVDVEMTQEPPSRQPRHLIEGPRLFD